MQKKPFVVSHGFSLIELLVVIAITATILAVALPNLLGARERARDARKKQEMNEMKNALRLYYNDWQIYPSSGTCGSYFTYVKGCTDTHVDCCPCQASADFAVGTSCDVVYMKKFPASLGTSIWYTQAASGDDFCLKTTLENAADPDLVTSQSRCATSCGGCSNLDYCVCSD